MTMVVRELALLLAFLIWYKKQFTHGIVLVVAAVGTFASYRQYFDTFSNLLISVVWSILSDCIALCMLLDLDAIGAIEKPRAACAASLA